MQSGTGTLNYNPGGPRVVERPSRRVVLALVLCGFSIGISALLFLITLIALARGSMAVLGIAVFGWTIPAVETAVVLPAVLLLVRGQPGRRLVTPWSWGMIAGVLSTAAGVVACWNRV